MSRILVVDDNEAFLKGVEITLRDRWPSCEIETASDGLEALRKILLSQERFDIVVTDVDMQPVNGDDLKMIIEILNREHVTNTRVLLMSGMVEKPPGDFIEKPFSADELDVKIRGVLDRN